MSNTLKRQAEKDESFLTLIRVAWLQGYEAGVTAGIQIGEQAYETREEEWANSEASTTLENCVQKL